jgi:two-component system, LuxR family, sensor kinase FixL
VHIPAFALIVGLVGFVQIHLRAGRRWLAWTTCAVRAFSLLLNFLMEPNVNYLEITRLRHISFLGDSVSVCEGVPSPWNLVGHLSLLLLVIFVSDAGITVWRRGDRRQAVVVGGSIVFFVLGATVQTMLARWEVFHWPQTSSLFFLVIVAAMAYELTREVLRVVQLSNDLQESEARMTMAAEAAAFGVWMWTIGTNRVWGSERWFRLFGFEPGADVSFEMVTQRIHPDYRERVEREVRRALADRGDVAVEYRVILPDGTQRWIASRGRMYPHWHGQPARMLGAAIDITVRKQTEQKIEQQRKELAHVARVSTMSQLTSSLAHELNQPLGAILRNAEAAELFLQDPLPDLDEVRAILADIRKDDQRAGAVIDRMRSLLKLREVEHSLLDLNCLAGEVIKIVRPEANSRKVRLALDPVSSLPPVRGDLVQLQQVLLNLLLNAMDALNDSAPDGRRVTTVRVQASGTQVEVAVSDTGHGIREDELLRVFEPFFTSKPHGLGMGLAISHGIIKAHGGRLWAKNNAAGGATFTFTLPAAERGEGRGMKEEVAR